MKKSSIAILKAARETLPHKPSDKWKYKKNGYISAVRQTLEVAQAVLDGKMDMETLQKQVKDAYSELAELDRQLEENKNRFHNAATVSKEEYNRNEKEALNIFKQKSDIYDRSRLARKLVDTAKVIELIDIPMSDYRFDYDITSNATYRDGKQDHDYRSYMIKRSIYSLTSRLNDEHSIKDVARVIEEDLKKRAESGKGKSTEKSTLPRTITIIAHAVSENNKRKLVYEIVSDTGRKGITLKDGFETAQAAAEFFKSEEGKAELEKRWAEFKDIKHYNPQESPRQGKDYRNGRNITAQELAETFGFRGVEFGNWADQNNRQKRLNETYDALMDMAAILDISPRAVGLGGKLGMAFGSRGSGWANAHFESDAFVINITKTRGAGSLAHEWLHALDNYFARQSESQHGMATDMHELNLKNMRDELKEKWMGLRRTLEMSAMKRRSNKHSDYWSRIWEVAARAFSRYIQDKAIANNMSNDYLVSLFPEELLTEIQKETTPYALAEDMETITPAFDAFFETLQEKVDESGNTALFSTVGDLQKDAVEYSEQDKINIPQYVEYKKKLNSSEYQNNAMLSPQTYIPVLDFSEKDLPIKISDVQNNLRNKAKDQGDITVINQDQRMPIIIESKGISEAGSGVALDSTRADSTSPKIHAMALENVEELLKKAKLGASHRDWHNFARNRKQVNQVHRFYVAMKHGVDTYGVKLTVYEWGNGNNKFYTLETHDLEVKKITPDSKTAGGVRNGTYSPVTTAEIEFSTFFEKFKPISDLLGLKYKEKYPDTRFSLTGDLGDTSLSPMDYRRSIDPLFDFVMEYTDNGIVNPGKEHEGEYFTGSFISSEFVAYSEKKPQGKKQSDKQYQQYLERRKQALDNAEGTPLDEIAAAYVRKFGGDEKDIAEQILDTLRDLTKRDLISDRAEAKREVAEHEKEQRKEDKAEYAKMKDAELTNQVNELFESKEPVTVDKRWVQMHREIYPKLYKTVFPNAEKVPDIPSSREMAIINEALSNGKMSEAAAVAEPYLTDKNLKAKGEIDETTHHYLMDVIRKWFPIIKKLEHYFRSEKGKEDLGIFRRVLSSPMWIAKHFKDNPVVKAIYQASQDLLDDRAKISNYLNTGTIEKLSNLRKQNKEEYKKLNEYLLKCDRDQTGAGVVKGGKDTLMWTAQDADGNVIGGYKTEEEAWAALFENEKNKAVENGIMSEAAADALFAFRDAMRRAYLFRIDTTLRALRQLGLINVDSTSFIIENAKEFFPDADVTGKIDLFELMREMGQRSGYYVPRIRHGRYMIKATKAGKPTILKGFEALNFVNRAWEIGKLERAGYKVETFVSNAPSQDMMGQVNPAAMMDIINQATIRANEKMKNDLTFEDVTYTKKDGTKEQHLVLSPDAKLNSQTATLLKNMGGMFIDGAWHFINSDITVKNNLEEVLKGQALTEAKMQMVMQSAIGASLVDMIRENGAGSSKIQRRTAKGDDVIRGYEEDLEKIAGLYLNGIAGSAARNIMAKKMYAAFGGMCFDREKYISDLIPDGLEEGTPEYYKARLNATAEYYKEVQRLALNSAKQPALTKYMDSYIKDMLRNTTGLEIGLGFLKGLSAMWLLTRPSGALNNLVGGIATNPAVIHGATNCGLMYAAKQVGVGAGLYNQYLFWNKYGKGKSLLPKDQELFDIIHENGWDGAELTKSATQAGLTFAGKNWKWLSEKLLKMFSLAEQTNRAAAIYASVQALCRQKGIDFNTLSKNDKYKLVKQAKEISDFGNGVYNKGNKLGFTRGGGWGAVADSAMLFQTYSVNYIDLIDNALEEGNLRGAAWLMTVTALAGGMKISVLGTILATLAGIGFADDGEEKDEAFYRVIAENMGQGFSNVLKYGLPTLAGVNMSGTYQDLVTDMMHDGLWDGNANITELPAFSIFRNMSNFFEYAGSGQGMKAAEQFMPSWGASFSRAIREANDGVTDRQGKRRKDVHDKYITADGYDTALRLFGFNPIDISEKTDRVYSEKKVREKFREMRKDITDDYRNIILDGNPSNEELADIAMRIEEYNAKARRSKRNVPFIDGTTLNNAVKDKDNKFLKDDLDEKDKKRIEKKGKGRIVIRNGKLVKE